MESKEETKAVVSASLFEKLKHSQLLPESVDLKVLEEKLKGL